MKKLVITLAVCLSGALCFTANAQALTGASLGREEVKQAVSNNCVLKAKDNLLTGSISLPAAKGFSPFVAATYENLLVDFGHGLFLGVGGRVGYIGFQTSSYDITSDLELVSKATWQSMFEVSALVDVHYVIKSFDLYGGGTVGYIINNVVDHSLFTYVLGARYFFNEHMAAGLQLGGWGTLSACFTYKF